jgi:hypothetical protein
VGERIEERAEGGEKGVDGIEAVGLEGVDGVGEGCERGSERGLPLLC